MEAPQNQERKASMSKKEKPEIRQYSVPMKWTMRGRAIVEATTPEEAVERAEEADGIDASTAELVDWKVVGDAELNE